MAERTFVMIKPTSIEHSGEIFDRLNMILGPKVERTHYAEIEEVPLSVIQEHYVEHKERDFYGYMTEWYEGQKVAIAVFEGEDIVQRMRDICGPTDPAEAPRNTLRGYYGTDSLKEAYAERRPVENVIHASDSAGSAEYEIGVWENYLTPASSN